MKKKRNWHHFLQCKDSVLVIVNAINVTSFQEVYKGLHQLPRNGNHNPGPLDQLKLCEAVIKHNLTYLPLVRLPLHKRLPEVNTWCHARRVLEAHLLLGKYGLKPSFTGLMAHLLNKGLITESKLDERKLLVAAAKYQTDREIRQEYQEGAREIKTRQIITRDKRVKADLLASWDGKCAITGWDLTLLPSDCTHLSHNKDHFVQNGGAKQKGDARLVYVAAHLIYDRLNHHDPELSDRELCERTKNILSSFHSNCTA